MVKKVFSNNEVINKVCLFRILVNFFVFNVLKIEMINKVIKYWLVKSLLFM